MRGQLWIKLAASTLTISVGLTACASSAERAPTQTKSEIATSDERNIWQSAFYGPASGADQARLAAWDKVASRSSAAPPTGAGEHWRYHCTGSNGDFVLIQDGASAPWTLQPARERGSLPLDVRAVIEFRDRPVDAQGRFQGGSAATDYRCVSTRED